MAATNFYKNFKAEDFINDEYFQNWVLNSGEEKTEEFWRTFQKNYPEKKTDIEAAKAILEKIPFIHVMEEDHPSDEKVRNSFEQVRQILGLKEHKTKTAPVFFVSTRWWATAASVLLILSLGYFFLTDKNTPQVAREITPVLIHDAAPGGNKAILTLGSGEMIILESAGNGTLSSEGGATILKLADGQIAYEGSTKVSTEIVYNTITTPAGGQYHLTLSDGTKVWLNAASSLRYPAAFTGRDRSVELTGEGYFEVAANKSKPFNVSFANTSVEVLGTHFNINAYPDENASKTSLLEGSVKVNAGSQNVILKPGQQAAVNHFSKVVSINKSVNLEEAIAWKNGLFQFDDTDIENVMRQIGRWYDVEVVFEQGVPAKRFTGKIYRNVNATEVFKILEVLDIHFKLEGRKVIVTK